MGSIREDRSTVLLPTFTGLHSTAQQSTALQSSLKDRTALKSSCCEIYKGDRSRVLPWRFGTALQSYFRPSPLYSPTLNSPPLNSPAPVVAFCPFNDSVEML